MPEIIGEYVDRLCTIEMRSATGNLARGMIYRLYDAARTNSRPLTLSAAEALLSAVNPGDTVFMLTGAGGPPLLPRGEVDGLLGTAALARVLTLGCGADVTVLAEERVEQPMRAACAGVGLNFASPDEAKPDRGVRFVPMPLEHEACRAQAEQLLAGRPAAVIAIEKLSPNAAGVIHGSTGINYDAVHAKPQYFVNGARESGVVTIGIGDGGNEVGFGRIRDTVRELLPAGADCGCGCGDGTAAAVATDILVVAAISNWGAYGVAAMMGWLDGTFEHLLNVDELERMLSDVVAAGAFDGCEARPVLSDDGVPLTFQRGFLAMLHGITELGRAVLTAPGH